MLFWVYVPFNCKGAKSKKIGGHTPSLDYIIARKGLPVIQTDYVTDANNGTHTAPTGLSAKYFSISCT